MQNIQNKIFNSNNQVLKTKISIIIPVYNIAPYIERCISSILKQVSNNLCIEVILVDDGSTDESGTICDSIAEKESCVNVYHKSNGGQSDARNYGLNKAIGEYIWFVDGDDFVADNALDVIFNSISLEQIDIVNIGYDRIFNDGTLETYLPSVHFCKSISGVDALLQLGAIPTWSSIFNRDFLIRHHLYFVKELTHEDFEFSVRSYSLARKVDFVTLPLYKYVCQRKGSIMNALSAKSPIGYVYSAIHASEFLEQNYFNKNDVNKIMKVVAIGVTFSFERLTMVDKDDFRKVISYYCENRQVISHALSYHSFVYRVIGLIFRFSPVIAFSIFKIIKKIDRLS